MRGPCVVSYAQFCFCDLSIIRSTVAASGNRLTGGTYLAQFCALSEKEARTRSPTRSHAETFSCCDTPGDPHSEVLTGLSFLSRVLATQ